MQPLTYDPDEPMPAQTADWTCAACSLAWLNRALGIDHATDEWSAVEYIGNPDNINSTYGLMDASGVRLRDCLREQGAPAFCSWLDWEWMYDLATRMPLLIGGVNWYHWVGVRTAYDGVLWIANSAHGWQGVTNTLSSDQADGLGPFAAVVVPLLTHFPAV
jgi:hypothetical protein